MRAQGGGGETGDWRSQSHLKAILKGLEGLLTAKASNFGLEFGHTAFGFLVSA